MFRYSFRNVWPITCLSLALPQPFLVAKNMFPSSVWPQAHLYFSSSGLPQPFCCLGGTLFVLVAAGTFLVSFVFRPRACRRRFFSGNICCFFVLSVAASVRFFVCEKLSSWRPWLVKIQMSKEGGIVIGALPHFEICSGHNLYLNFRFSKRSLNGK